MKRLTLLLSAMLLAWATNLWAETATLDNLGTNVGSTSNTEVATTNITATETGLGTFTLNYLQGKKQGNSILLAKSTGAFISNKTPIPGAIKSVEVFINSGASGKTTYHCAFGTSEFTKADATGSTAVNIAGGKSNTFTCSVNGAQYFCISLGNANNGQVLKVVVTYDAATLQSIEIAGEPTKTTYMAGDAFSTAGLKVMGTYEGDDTPKEITTGITWEVTPTTLTAGLTEVEVKATVGEKSTTRTITDLTVNAAKTLISIAVSGTPAVFWKGDTFNHDGMTVTANWDDDTHTDVTVEAEFSAPDMATAGTQTVTVTYKEKTATYDITVKTIANTQETAYTVAEAIALIDAGKDLTAEVFVKGIVSKIVTPWSDEYQNITYNISDDGTETSTQFQLFRCLTNGYNVGDAVIAKGVMKKYDTTYEFDAGNKIVAIAENTNPVLTCDKSVAFGNISSLVGTAPSKTLEVTAKNLTEDITVTLSEDAAFTLSTTTLPAEGGTIEITPVLTVGENTATLTLTSGEKSVVVILTATIQQAYTISWVVDNKEYTAGNPTTAVIEGEKVSVLPTAPANNTLSCSNIFVGWSTNNLGSTAGQTQPEDLFTSTGTAPVVTENTTYHAVFATADGEEKVYFKETFDSNKSTGGNNNVWKEITATVDITSDSLGWAFENGYAASACIRIGKSSAQGSATTPALTGLTGNAVLTFRAGAWDGDATTLNLSITPETATLSETSVTLSNAAFSTYTINITDATEESKIKFQGAQASKARFFLDDVVVKNAVTLKDFRTNCEGVSTAIESAAVETSVVKTIENGQLVIIRDGVKYNAMGVRLQ